MLRFRDAELRTVMMMWREWLRSLEATPRAATRRERLWLLALVVLGAISRLAAVAKSAWDWDEMLFLLAIRDYDVALHQPHPPGFPLFIATARALRLVIDSDFRALQAVSVIASMALLPAMYLLGRELRLDPRLSAAAGVLMIVLPNVWLYGGSALSDVPAVTLCVVACALLLRGVRSPAWMIAGGAVAGASIAYRPQNLLIVAVPFAIALMRRPSRTVLAGLVLVAIAGASFWGAAAVTGVDEYVRAVTHHQKYIQAHDSFMAPGRPSLARVADDFFVYPFRRPLLNIVLGLLMIGGLVHAIRARAAGVLVVIASFLPFCLFALLFLDWLSASRFSVGYMPLYAFTAAAGLHALGARGTVIGTAAVAAISMQWMVPGLAEVRNTVAPPVAAAEWVARHAPDSTVMVNLSMAPAMKAVAPQVATLSWDGERPFASWLEDAEFLVSEDDKGEVVFRRSRRTLWKVARHRFFDASVTRIRHRVKFGEGWYGQEGRGSEARRWSTKRSTALLPYLGPRARLSFGLYAPVRGQTVEIQVDGVARQRTTATEDYVSFDRVIEAASPREVVLTIISDQASSVPGDTRELALRLEGLSWSAE